MADVNVLGSLEAKFESTNRIYGVEGVSPTLSTMQGDNQEPKILIKKQQIKCGLCSHFMDENCDLCGCDRYDGFKDEYIVAMRGRNPNNPSDRTVGSPTEQRLELNEHGTSNCLTSVQKDNMLLTTQYRIRKLTPRECGRLMDVSDEDISKMEKVNSNTQLYKQFGNSIVVGVMCEMFKNLNINQ